MVRRALFLVITMAAVSVPMLQAQSNEVLDAVLGEAALSYGSAAYLVGTASGHVAESATPAEAVTQLEQGALGLRGRAAADPITLGEYSYMLTRAFRIPGGIMYRILPGPRYAVRELAYLGVISGPAKAGMAVSGEQALHILERVLHGREAAQ